MRLCGISSHFRLLSPSTRQVTHALLTRPPLETDQIRRSLNEMFPVRLACVKHAASVHPEPGSNSLIKCLIHSRQPTSLVISRFYCFWFKTVLKNKCKEFSRIVCVSLFSYQGRLSCDILFILSHLFHFVKNFFKFFQSFSNSSGFPDFFSDVRLSALFKRLDYFNTFVFSCQALF